MGPRNKRQKLTEAGAEAATVGDAEPVLSHSKSANSEKQSTLYVRSLPLETTNESLAEHFSQSFPVKHAVVVTDKETGKCKGYGFVTFVDHEDARRALEEFHGADLGGKKLNVSIAERRQREDGPAKEEKEAQSARPPPQSSKLIVRNLPWSIDTPEKLTKLFLSFGKINQAVVPKDNHGRMKGFGIVMLRGRKNAELALERLNGKEMDGRTLAVDWAADKETWQQAQQAAKDAEKQEKDAKNDTEGQKEKKTKERVDSGQSDEEGEDTEDEGEAETPADLAEDLEVDEDAGEDADMDDVDEDDEDDAEEEVDTKPKMTSNESVVFVRNLPFTSTDEDLYEHFGELFPVRYARIVMDRDTERPRGTGFVCFYKKEDADTCIREAPKAAKPQEDKSKKSKGKNITGPSILENEFSDPSGKYTMDGRVLQITRAVDKNEADRLATEGVESRNKRDRDKRRLYLLGEGTVPSNSPLYSKLSPSEIAMRDASAKQRRKLIDSNPSLNISLTRLSIRNIPRSVTTADLKALAREAIVGFATQVKQGKREKISKEELLRDTPEILEMDKERRNKKKGVVKQAKIIFEGSEGSKVEEGSGRSRGYGFVEYWTHRSALMGLRWLNGHAIDYQAQMEAKKGKGAKVSREDVQERKKRLIVEFAIENANVVKRRNDREVKAREKPKGDRAKGKKGEEEGTDGVKKFRNSRGQLVDKKGSKGRTPLKEDGFSGAARRVMKKEAERSEDGRAELKGKTGKERADIRRAIAAKRRDKKDQRRAAKGKGKA